MEYRRLGRTDLKASSLGVGTEHIEKSSEDADGIHFDKVVFFVSGVK